MINSQIQDAEALTSVKVADDIPEIWEWCSNTFPTGSWSKRFGLLSTSSTYFFNTEQDALLFRLRWPK